MTHAADLQRIIDSGASDISADFLGWVEGTLDATEWDLFERAIEAGDFGQAANLIQWAEYAPQAALGAALGAAAKRNADHISDITGLKYAFDLKDPNALEWIEKHGAELVVDIGDGAKQDLREVIYRGYFSGYTPRQQSEYIRSIVGLDERRLRAVDNYALSLRKKGLSNTEISAKSKKYSENLLKKRARTIAVNEASEAANRGQYLSTKDAYNRGILGPEWEGFRIVTGDERLCDRCGPLAGEARSLPDGVYPSSGDVITKLHVLCRCCEGYRKITLKEAIMKQGQIEEAVESSVDVVFERKGIKETDDSIFVPTVPIVEGVFSGRGFPVLRKFEEFGQRDNYRWLNGLPVAVNHAEVDDVDTRLPGQLGSVEPDPAKKRIKAVTEFSKRDLTPRELQALKEGKQDGSLRVVTNLEYTPGTWNGKPYDAIERSPYRFREYSLVSNGVVTTDDGAGFGIECSVCGAKSPSQSPAHRADSRGENMTGDTKQKSDPGHEPDVREAVKPLIAEAVEAAEKRMEAKYQARIEELENEAKAREILEFRDELKPAFKEKAAEFFEAFNAKPLEWYKENKDKLIVKADESKLKGSAVTEGAKDEVAEARAKADAKLRGRS